MSYSVPPRWSHGDIPDATAMNKYSDSLDAIYAVLGDAQMFFPAAAAIPAEDNDQHYLIHRYRWLWFEGAGAIEDPSGAGDDVTLSDDGAPTRVDLRSVSWLAPGMLYKVTGSTWCMETRNP